MGDVFRFLWIAFRQYWATWVTGTGLIGFSLWLLNWYSKRNESKGRKPMTFRQNALILFCTFWFLATFSAWHDADKNLTNVIHQRAEDNGKLWSCQGDLKAKTQLAESYGNLLSQEQAQFSNQQNTVNTCVVALGKSVVPEKQHTTLAKNFDYPASIGGIHYLQFLLMTNQAVSPVRMTVECEEQISKVDVGMIGAGALEMEGPSPVTNGHSSSFAIHQPEWDKTRPIVITISSPFTVENCGIR